MASYIQLIPIGNRPQIVRKKGKLDLQLKKKKK